MYLGFGLWCLKNVLDEGSYGFSSSFLHHGKVDNARPSTQAQHDRKGVYTFTSACLIQAPPVTSQNNSPLKTLLRNQSSLITDTELRGPSTVSPVTFSRKEKLRSILETVLSNDIIVKNEQSCSGVVKLGTRKPFMVSPFDQLPFGSHVEAKDVDEHGLQMPL
ncbi:hypothetical protein P7K49_026717 [Saguinus oedipus]|uniref:Uncharacterized protein n=1 Tax=Saguinus oedipus TaxID=9490 RepID=A0ABQ9UEE2_SAGOE|nr:hypothetical protein P7K49_026717 [Saguinus oedipus]